MTRVTRWDAPLSPIWAALVAGFCWGFLAGIVFTLAVRANWTS